MKPQSSIDFKIIFLILICGVFPQIIAQESEMSGDLKAFLKGRSFPELIAEHAQDHISIYIQGKEAKAIAARPYTIEKGYRCQIFAGADYANARQIFEKARELKLDSIYVIDSGNLFKVQMGNFAERRNAEILLDKLKYAGLSGAWIVETDIHVPKSQQTLEAITQRNVARQQAAPNKYSYYTVQILATKDLAKAEQLRRIVENDYRKPTELVSENSYWKVLIGRFSIRSEAEDFLRILKRKNFSDAWITQK